MAIHAAFPPPPDSLARIAKSADGDILASKMVSPNRNRGRGAQSNLSGRFEVFQNESFDDGWQSLEALADFKTNVREERAKSIITKNESPDLNFDRSINPYRGCEHGCSYCFARQTHAYLGHSAGIDFERELYAKTNAAERLREELSRKKYTPKPIAIGTNTDPYQPIERERKIMREILEVLIEFKHPVTIVTKSALVVRDLDLLTELAEQNLVHVAMSITTLDRKLCRELEPRASTPSKRLEAVELLSQSGIPTMVMAAPIIPAINDSELEKILDAAAAQGATAAGMIMLRLPGEVRNIFREWLLRFYPDKLRHVLNLVRDVRGGRNNDPRFGSRMSGQGPYAYALQRRFELAMNRNGLKKRLPHLRTDLFTQPEVPEDQLSLF
ncbi:PA0069 family radical SAM protein [uncultured Maritalea sp.]|uniref:PA0069 family radical SAM protein n=1 Tax=uncultured Maritalea sp. TaxID=757249 RepID=UPI002620CB43|nr:PA0069 family radical SAM protein [uncultured Maritalea sp.]